MINNLCELLCIFTVLCRVNDKGLEQSVACHGISPCKGHSRSTGLLPTFTTHLARGWLATPLSP